MHFNCKLLVQVLYNILVNNNIVFSTCVYIIIFTLSFHHLLEKEVDGETLLMLGSCATMEMLNSCGLCTLKQQLLLRKLIAGSQASSSADTNPATSNSQKADPVGKNLTRNSKLTLHAMRSMKDVDKRMYLMKLVVQVAVLLPNYADYLLGETWCPQRLQRSGQEIIFLVSATIKHCKKSSLLLQRSLQKTIQWMVLVKRPSDNTLKIVSVRGRGRLTRAMIMKR